MMLRETAMQIKYLARQGMQKSRIAERFSVCRQTVYNHLIGEAARDSASSTWESSTDRKASV